MIRKILRFLNSVLPLILMALACIALFHIAKGKTSTINIAHIRNSIINNLPLALFAVFLMIPNWLIETMKWKSLINQFTALSFAQSLKSVLAGIGFSIFTPNRVGDIGGRLVYIAKNKRWVVLYMTFLSSASQLFTTIIIGSISIYYFHESIPVIENLSSDFILSTLLCGNSILLILYLFLEKFRKLHTFLLPKLKSKIQDFPSASLSQKLQLLCWSLLRYQFFALQFFLMVLLLGSQIDFITAYFALALVYVFTSFLPSSVISEIPVRGSVAFYIFSMLNLDAEPALIAFVSMWLINLLLPALFSLLLLKDFKLSKISRPKFV